MIIWIASYPKSGNTWVRAMLAAFFYSEDGIFDFNLLRNIKEFPRDFEFISNKLTDSVTLDIMAKEWLIGQQQINNNSKVKFLKTHSVIQGLSGYDFTDKSNSLAGIYIVRDPRNVITSLSNHFDLNMEASYELLTDEARMINNGNSAYTLISDWKYNYISWRFCEIFKVKIVRYEDLVNSTKKEFEKILKFLRQFIDLDLNQTKIQNVIKSTEFSRMKSMQQSSEFVEAQIRSGEKKDFFYLGKDNKWEKYLDEVFLKKITRVFYPEMKELGYI